MVAVDGAGLFPGPDGPARRRGRHGSRSVRGREPFPSSPVPLELINPVDGFTPAASKLAGLGTRTIRGSARWASP